MKEIQQPKMINQLHLNYLLAIAAIVIIALSAYYYGGGIKAGEMVSFASTLSSIILSVIAIIMTIVDVAGQRNTVIDLKETAEKLEKNLVEASNGIEEINALKDELLISMNNIIKSNLEVTKQIVELKEKYSNTNQEAGGTANTGEILADLNNLSEKINEVKLYNSFNNNLKNRSKLTDYRRPPSVKFVLKVQEEFNEKTLDSLVSDIINEFRVTYFDRANLNSENKTLTLEFRPSKEFEFEEFNYICQKYNCRTLVRSEY